jgi:NAD(P)-dependent dehydrogenase (short-subunit alcohol dehydrogenase family)
MKNEKKPEVVVVTGASAGVGRATVRAFAAQGAYIGLLARGREGLKGANQDIEERGGKGLVIPTDVSDPDQVESAAKQVEDTFGPITIWVNNAMVTVYAAVKDTKPEEFRRATEVTYLGYVYGTLAALKRMLVRDQGVIVQVGSSLAYRSIPLQAAYCGAEHAIAGFTDSLRSELIHDKSKVRITMVQLPGVNTPQFGWSKSRLAHQAQPMPPIYQPEVAAEAIVWAAHHPRRQFFVGMPTVLAIETNKIAPGLMDRYLARSAYAGEQFDGMRDPKQPDNLWEPVSGDHGEHGDFDDRAHARSQELWVSKNRNWLLPAMAGVVSAAGAAFTQWRRHASH